MAVVIVGATTGFSASSPSVSLAKHASALTGDYMLAMITRTGTTTTFSTLPGNFVAMTPVASSTNLAHLPARGTVQSGDSSTYTFTTSASATSITAGLLFLRSLDGTTPLDATAGPDSESGTSDTTIPLPGMTTTDANDLRVALVSHNQNATFTPTYTWPDGSWVLQVLSEGSIAARCTVIGTRVLAALNPAAETLTCSVAGNHAATSTAMKPAGAGGLVIPDLAGMVTG